MSGLSSAPATESGNSSRFLVVHAPVDGTREQRMAVAGKNYMWISGAYGAGNAGNTAGTVFSTVTTFSAHCNGFSCLQQQATSLGKENLCNVMPNGNRSQACATQLTFSHKPNKPRFPIIEVNAIDLTSLSNLTSAFSFSYKNPAKPNLNELVLEMNVTMRIGTYNPNLYGLDVERIDLTAWAAVNTSYVYNPLKTNSLTSYGALVKVVGPTLLERDPSYRGSNNSVLGYAKTNSSLFFPSKTWLNYTMLFTLRYSPDPKVGLLEDPTVLELADVCGITSRYSPRGRPMRIHYEALSTIPALRVFRYAPSISNDIQIICPFSQAQIDGVIGEVQAGATVDEALQKVFGGTSRNQTTTGQSEGNASGTQPVIEETVTTTSVTATIASAATVETESVAT
ncbi:hypothetical protein CcCBS67573_g08397 [Chytriomyces confervae]|uniref:Uncharacterized protein n=1 Tax=Chytriomyces confervae TaxID=246404 RepID=A0A507EMR1_9FUNG|nr:hypothetical protein CcCBS67573_g08397 [Chytriomyces confervae]